MSSPSAIRTRILHDLENAIGQTQSFKHADKLRSELASLSEHSVGHFADAVDEFAFPLVEWLLALDWFIEWEHLEKRTLSIEDKIDYLSCCAQGAIQDGHLVSLPHLLEDYVRSYGVEKKR